MRNKIDEICGTHAGLDKVFGLGSPTQPKKAKKRTISAVEKKWIWRQKKRHVCGICNKVVREYLDAEFDHKVPFSEGGPTTPANTLIVHKICNRMKGKKSLKNIREHLGVDNE